VTATIISFAEARAARLRKQDTPLARIFRNLEGGPNLDKLPTEMLLQWADRINNAKDSDTMADVCADVERMIEQHQRSLAHV
jgi:hypothetical protein